MDSNMVAAALTDIVDGLEQGLTNGEIISNLDRDYSIPPTEGRQLVVYARSLVTRITTSEAFQRR